MKEKEKKKIEKIKELLGRINLEDIDRDEDLMWFVADLWCLEKHLSTSLYMLKEKIKKEPENEYFKKLFQLIVNVLKRVREERTKHLERLYFIKEYGVWCLPPETLVYKNFGVCPIGKIDSTTTKVLTSNGKFENINSFYERHYKGELICIQSYYFNLPIKITPEHPVLVIKNLRRKQKDWWRKNFKWKPPLWEQASKIKETDFLLFPRVKKIIDKRKLRFLAVEGLESSYKYPKVLLYLIQNKDKTFTNKDLRKKFGYNGPTVTKILEVLRKRKLIVRTNPKEHSNKARYKLVDNIEKKIYKEIEINEDFMRLVGLYLSDGCVVRYKRKERKHYKYHLHFTFNKKEKELIKFVIKMLTKLCNRKPYVLYRNQKERKNVVEIVSTFKPLARLFLQFGKNAKEKQLPEWCLYLPFNKQFSLIKGLIEGDGHIDKFFISYSTVSKKLAFQIRLILFRLGILNSLSIENKTYKSEIYGRRVEGKMTIYDIRVSGDSARELAENCKIKYFGGKKTSGNFGFVTNDFILIPIRKIWREKYEGMVYNLGINGNETYVLPNMIVHNCSVKHLLGAMMQASEVAGKDIHIAIEKEKELEKLEKEGRKEEVEKLKKEIEKDWENVKKDLETSKFCHDLLILFKQFSQKFKKQ